MGERPHYTEIDHTADVGVELRAHDLVSAFERAGACMFDLICPLDEIGSGWSRRVTVEGRSGDLEHLMIRWLSELLYLFTSEQVLLSRFEIEELDVGGRIVAVVHGEKMDAARHAVRVEIKAATYHSLRVDETPEGWVVRVIFDT
jgi:SHS2 domain-containing protein